METLPSVSVIMPIGYGDKYFRMALECFLNQTYEGPLEIVIVDNSPKPIEALLPVDPRIKYLRCGKMPVGALRNLGTLNATGEICVTGDEDDWSSNDRVAVQVARLLASGKSVTGFHNILYYDMRDGGTYKYHFEADVNRNHPPYAMGTSQMYLKSFWQKRPFPESGVEDYEFQLTAMHLGQLDSCDGDQLCVARAHPNSQCPPQFGHRQFPAVPISSLPNQFFTALKEQLNG